MECGVDGPWMVAEFRNAHSWLATTATSQTGETLNSLEATRVDSTLLSWQETRYSIACQLRDDVHRLSRQHPPHVTSQMPSLVICESLGHEEKWRTWRNTLCINFVDWEFTLTNWLPSLTVKPPKLMWSNLLWMLCVSRGEKNPQNCIDKLP